MAEKQASQKPKIAVFSGTTATIQNSEPLVTSNKAREKHGLALRGNPDGSRLAFDALRLQRIAAPVTVYVEQFSAHPLERDASELYTPRRVHRPVRRVPQRTAGAGRCACLRGHPTSGGRTLSAALHGTPGRWASLGK